MRQVTEILAIFQPVVINVLFVNGGNGSIVSVVDAALRLFRCGDANTSPTDIPSCSVR